MRSTKLPVPNALVFIQGMPKPQVPQVDGKGAIWATASCIAVGCMSDIDGETRITLGASNDLGAGAKPAFDGALDTPARVVTIETVSGKTILEQKVTNTRTRVRVWVNHPMSPDDVVVALE